MIVLTPDHIEQLRTPAGGFNEAAMELVGVWPLRAGWQERLVGKKIGDRRWRLALEAAARPRHYFHGNTRRGPLKG